MMARSRIDAVEALERLTKLSRDDHVKLVQLGRTLVDEAVRRAQASHG